MLNLRFLKEKKLPLIDAYAIHLWFVFSACHKSSRSCEWVQWCLFLNILKWHRFYRNKKKQWPKINKQTNKGNKPGWTFFLSVSSHYAVKHEWALTCLLDTTSTTLGVFGKNVLIYDKLFSYSLINQEKTCFFFHFGGALFIL